MKSYSEKLQDPRWQKRRLEVLNRDGWMCCHCQNREKTLHVHHLNYSKGKQPWAYPLNNFVTLCKDCHLEVEEAIERARELMKNHETTYLIIRISQLIYSDPDIPPLMMNLKIMAALDAAGL